MGAYFVFWPISTPAGTNCVLAVDFAHAARERPDSPEQIIEVIAAYVTALLLCDRNFVLVFSY